MPVQDEIDVVDLWRDFLHGHWTKVPPTVPGTYPTADRAGFLSKDIIVGELKGELYYAGAKNPAWGGWWWSEPRPDMPPAPVSWEGN